MKRILSLAWSLLAAGAVFAGTPFSVDNIFGDHMVLQRGKTIRVSGNAEPGLSVKVAFRDETRSVKAKDDGRWSVEFPPTEAGGPYEMRFTPGWEKGHSFVFTDILVGDVWVCSGQSNMSFPVWEGGHAFFRLPDGPAVAKAAHDNRLRLYNGCRSIATAPCTDMTGRPVWRAADTPSAVLPFSAVGYFFGKKLREALENDIPVGMVHASWGGTRIEPWIPESGYGGEVPKPVLATRAEFADWLGRFRSCGGGASAAALANWGGVDLDTSAWKKGPKELMDGLATPGIAWYRFAFTLPESSAGHEFVFHMDAVNDADTTYLDGRQIGATGPFTGVAEYWHAPRDYPFAATAGRHVVAVRAEDHYGTGYVGSGVWIEDRTTGAKIDFTTADWFERVEFKYDEKRLGARPETVPDGVEPQTRRDYPTGLYNAMIHPVSQMNVCGVIWYQGCSNSGAAQSYAALEKALVDSWRMAFRDPALPFVATQLSALQKHTPAKRPAEDWWRTVSPEKLGFAPLREAQERMSSYPNTGLACTIDLGDPFDIHPVRKAEVSERLVHEALRVAYGRADRLPGPRFASMRRDGSRLRISFRDVGEGLEVRGGEIHPHMFALAGDDGRFAWAEARFESDGTVSVWSDEVAEPVAVRYAYSACPPKTTIYRRGDGLPLFPFNERLGGDHVRTFADEVDLFVGTAGTGHTTPAACRPFGAVQAGPDTGVLDWKYCSGYQFGDRELFGFSSSHISGSGCGDLGDVLLLPFARETVAPRAKLPFDKASERAEPGYYSVRLPEEGVRAEMTATPRVGVYRFTYSADRPARLLVDFQHGVVVFGEWGVTNRVLACEAEVCGDLAGAEAARTVAGWTKRRSFEVVRFSRPARRVTELAKAHPCERGPRYVFEFAASAEPLVVKVALSTVSLEGARQNLAAETPDWNFDAVRAAARDEWSALLRRFDVTGSSEQRALFYTAIYHLCVQPHDVSDCDGRYRGADDRIHRGVHYGEMSLWDTYRASHPLYTLILPERVDGFVRSLVAQSQEQGYLPIWPLHGQETDCMVGNPAVSVIADAYLKGFRGFDAEAAFAEVKRSLDNPRPHSRVDLVDRFGYFPNDLVATESVSMLLEDAINCDGAAKFASALGRAEDAARYAKRAKGYRNAFDRETGFFRGRASDGSWRTPFDPLRICNAYALGGDFTEGNAWQYLWLVPHDPDGLVELLGGKEAFFAKLDELFRLPSHPPGQPRLLDVTGLVGQYAHGNEPSQHIAFLYAREGRPARTQELVRDLATRFYSLAPDGVCGNEDNGQMSAWYVFAALGFYPLDPCAGEYVLGAPQLPGVSLALTGGKRLSVRTVNWSEKNVHVRSVTFDGRPVTGHSIRHADLAKGGELVFEMMP